MRREIVIPFLKTTRVWVYWVREFTDSFSCSTSPEITIDKYKFSFSSHEEVLSVYDHQKVIDPIVYCPENGRFINRGIEKSELGKQLTDAFDDICSGTYFWPNVDEQCSNYHSRKQVFDRLWDIGGKRLIVPKPLEIQVVTPNFFNMVETASKLAHA